MVEQYYCPSMEGEFAVVYDWKQLIQDTKSNCVFLEYFEEYMRLFYCKWLPLQSYQCLGIDLPTDIEEDVVNRSYQKWVKESNRYFGKDTTKEIISRYKKQSEALLRKIVFPDVCIR